MSEFKNELMEMVNKYYPDCKYTEIKVDKSYMTQPASMDIRVME
jgi:hypothetical protein